MKESQTQLYKKYPKLFRQKDLPMSETCMCWGLQCGQGWYTLIDNLCEVLQALSDTLGVQAELREVKEKYGYLHTSVSVRPTWKFWKRKNIESAKGVMQELCLLFEIYSWEFCESCGRQADGTTKGYITRLCSSCSKKEKRDIS